MTTHPDPDIITIRIPVSFKRRGGRKLVLAPDGTALEPTPAASPATDTMQAVMIKAFRWRRRIESGAAASITDLAEQEGVSDTYVIRILTLTCLAPDIVAAILDGRQPRGISLNHMLKKIPESWDEQRALWEFSVAR